MKLMRAARIHGQDHHFRIDRIPVPEPTGADVLVRVRTCGIVPNLRNVIVNYPKWAPDLPLPRSPAIFGLDPAGEIAAVGPDVIGLQVGQRAYVNPLRSCGSCSKCRNGVPVACPHLAFAGYFGFAPSAARIQDRYPWGGFAEFLVAPASSIVELPESVSFDQASRFGYLGTSYSALTIGRVGPRTSVLVNGATGTLGVGAVMLALAMGAPRVLAVARNRELLE